MILMIVVFNPSDVAQSQVCRFALPCFWVVSAWYLSLQSLSCPGDSVMDVSACTGSRYAKGHSVYGAAAVGSRGVELMVGGGMLGLIV